MMEFDMSSLQDEGIFFLWVTGRAIDIGRQCLKKWGYNHIEELIWCKTNQLGRTICTGRTGHWLNHSKEHVLMGYVYEFMLFFHKPKPKPFNFLF